MTVQQTIEAKLGQALDPVHLEVINESGMHAVEPGSETHFRVRVVSGRFDGMPLLERHRTVYSVLEKEKREHVHALAVEALTPAEWQERGGRGETSPPCLGGSKTG